MNAPPLRFAAMFVAVTALAASAFAQLFPTPAQQASRDASARMWAEAHAQLREQIWAFNKEIAEARDQFWATFPDKPGAGQTAAKFKDLLRQKDIYFMSVALSNGMANYGGVGVELDEGIRRTARPEFEDIVAAAKEQGGMLRGVNNAGDIFRNMVTAIDAHPKHYSKYCWYRDWWEYDRVKRIPVRWEKPETYGVYLYYRFAKLPEEDAASTYNQMAELFGKQLVYAAAKKVMDAPKNEIGHLVVTVPRPVRKGPGGSELDDVTVPMPDGVIGVFGDPLTALKRLVTKDDDRRFLLFYLSGRNRSFIGNISDPLTEWAWAELLYRRLVLAFGEKEVLETARVVRTATKRLIDFSVMDSAAIGARRSQPLEVFEDILARKNPRGYVRSALISAEKFDSPAAVDAAYTKLVSANNEDAVLETARKWAAKPVPGSPSLVSERELENLVYWLRNPLPPEAPVGPFVDHPDYLAWKGFAAGAKVSHATREWQLQRSRAGDTRLVPGPVTSHEAYQLQSINNEQAKLWFTETYYDAFGRKKPAKDSEVGYPAKFSLPANGRPTQFATTRAIALLPSGNYDVVTPASAPIESGEETVEINGRKIATRWQSVSYAYKPSSVDKDSTLVVKVWTSDAVPTGLVRRTQDIIIPPSNTRFPYGARYVSEMFLESFEGSRPGVAAPDPSRPVAPAYVPPPAVPSRADRANEPTPAPATKPPPPVPTPTSVPPRTLPQRSLPPSAPPPVAFDQFAVSQRFSVVTMRATHAKGGLVQLEYRPAGQGVQIPAEIRDARDRVDARLQAAIVAIQKRDANETEQILRSVEADLAVIEKFLKR